jgi:exosortase
MRSILTAPPSKNPSKFVEPGAFFRRHLCFVVTLLGSSLVFAPALRSLLHFAMAYSVGFHTLLVIPVSSYFVYRNRREIFSRPPSGFIAACCSVIAFIGVLSFHEVSKQSSGLSFQILELVTMWVCAFVFFYGLQALWLARSAVLFLFLLIPIPNVLAERIILFLQERSADVAFWLFRTCRVPVFREGLVLHVPTLDLAVAEQCSGIRSSMVLFVTTFILGELVLHSFWSKSLLIVSVLPIVIFKNGLRIVTVSLLTIYVNRGFLHGWLHQSGGVVFYLLGLTVLIVIAKLLRTAEGERNWSRHWNEA